MKNVAPFLERTFQKLMHFLLGSRIAGGNCVPGELHYKLNYEAWKFCFVVITVAVLIVRNF